MEGLDMNNMISSLMQKALEWSPRLVGAILILIIGFWIAGWATRLVERAMNRSGLDKDVQPFLKSLTSVLFKILVIITAASAVGIEMTAFAALLAAAGLAVGMALQGTLGHFASGVMILIFKPYKVGDLVSLQDQTGHVDEIQVFNTVLTTLDNKKVIIPNGVATSGIMTNLTVNGKLRVDLSISVAYEEDFEKVKSIVKSALDRVKDKLDIEPTIEIDKFEESNILLAVRPYASPENYWNVYFDANREIKKAFNDAGIKISYPVREIIKTNE